MNVPKLFSSVTDRFQDFKPYKRTGTMKNFCTIEPLNSIREKFAFQGCDNPSPQVYRMFSWVTHG